MILKLIWRNLWRNKRRTFITMTSITFAVLLAVSMKSLQKGIFDNLVKNVVRFHSGFIQIHKTGYWDEQVLDNSFNFSDALLQTLRKTEHVSGIVPRIESFVLASSDIITHGCMLVGTLPQEENALTDLKSKIISGNYFNANDAKVIISEGLAKRLGLAVHDTIVLLGQGYQGSSAAAKYPVKAIVRFGSPQLNESLVFLPLAAAQNFFSAENQITTIALNIDIPSTLNATSKKIAGISGDFYEVLTWEKMMPDIESHIRADDIDFYIFIGVLYLLIAFGIFGTILMMLAERKYEFGMLMAIGMKKIKLGCMLVGETILISIIGTFIGLLLSFPVVKYFEVHPITLGGQMAEAYKNFGFDAIWPATVDLNIFFTQAVIVLCLALIIGLFPLLKIQRIDPVNSMKR